MYVSVVESSQPAGPPPPTALTPKLERKWNCETCKACLGLTYVCRRCPACKMKKEKTTVCYSKMCVFERHRFGIERLDKGNPVAKRKQVRVGDVS